MRGKGKKGVRSSGGGVRRKVRDRECGRESREGEFVRERDRERKRRELRRGNKGKEKDERREIGRLR